MSEDSCLQKSTPTGQGRTGIRGQLLQGEARLLQDGDALALVSVLGQGQRVCRQDVCRIIDVHQQATLLLHVPLAGEFVIIWKSMMLLAWSQNRSQFAAIAAKVKKGRGGEGM